MTDLNRPDLMALLGQRVTITRPGGSSTWTGKLIAVGREPCAVIEQDRGPRLCLPQSYAITPADELAPQQRALTADQHIRGVAHNAVQQALDEHSHWLPLTARMAIADAVIAALPPATTELEQLRADIGDLNDLISSERAIHEQWISRNDAARALHPTPAELAHANSETGIYCPTCITPAPCPTRTALDGEDTDRG